MSEHTLITPSLHTGKWTILGICEELEVELLKNGFSMPNSIQSSVLPNLLGLKKDSFVAAETGSGKTFLYALSILNFCQMLEKPNDKLRCIIMTPTRELALQVKAAINELSKPLNIHCIDIIGGMSEIKQERVLSKKPQIVVATPGRLWTYMSEKEHEYFQDLSGLKLLVIDEVDRMTELGHFFQMKKIIDFIKNNSSHYSTYVFSATLALHKDTLKFKSKKGASTFDKISEFIGVKNFNIFDHTISSITPQTLQEYKLMCRPNQIHHLLYYILLSSQKTIIFVNAIKTSDYLRFFLTNLNFTVLRLHSKMQQRCRLKLYDRFKASRSVLIATDVAARGLDIPDVDTVIHFNVPTNPDTYVHRSGRTARQRQIGKSIMFITPESHDSYKKILITLNRDDDLLEYPIIYDDLKKHQKVSDVSKRIADEMVKLGKLESKYKWFVTKSKECEIELDETITNLSKLDLEALKLSKKKIFHEQKNLAAMLKQ